MIMVFPLNRVGSRLVFQPEYAFATGCQFSIALVFVRGFIMTWVMRSILLFFLLIALPAHAETPPLPPEVKAAPVVAPTAWRSLSEAARREIVSAWKTLPEATRPPFPVFRDTQIEKMLSPAATTPQKN